MKNRLYRWMALLALLPLLSSCAASEVTQPAKNTASAAPEASATPAPSAGGELKMAMPAGITTMNPLKADTRELSSLLWLIYESPVRLDETGKPSPELCESWEVEEDGTWVFHVRENVTWHGGGRLNAHDIAYTLEQIKGTPSTTGPESQPENTDEPETTGDENTPDTEPDTTPDGSPLYKAYAAAIESYAVRDDMTLAVKPKVSGYSMLYAMTFPIIPKAPVSLYSGTGPYVVEDYQPDSAMRLVVNETWWKRQPYIESISLVAVETHEEELARYESGEIDMVNSSLLHSGKYRGLKDTTISDMQSSAFDYLLPNLSDPIMKNILIREAIACALDKREIISKAVYNHAITADSPISANSWLYDGTASEFIEHDLKLAQQLLAEAGWTDRNGDPTQLEAMGDDGKLQTLSVRLLVSENADNPIRREAADIIAEQLSKVGFSVEIIAKPWEDFVTDIENGSFQLALTGAYLSKFPDYSSLLGSGGRLNVGGYSSERMDAALAAILSAPDEAAFKHAVAGMQSLVNSEIPIIGLYLRCNTLVYNGRVKGIYGLRDMEYTKQVDKWYLADQ